MDISLAQKTNTPTTPTVIANADEDDNTNNNTTTNNNNNQRLADDGRSSRLGWTRRSRLQGLLLRRRLPRRRQHSRRGQVHRLLRKPRRLLRLHNLQTLLQRDEVGFQSYTGVHQGWVSIRLEAEKDVRSELIALRVAVIDSAETVVRRLSEIDRSREINNR